MPVKETSLTAVDCSALMWYDSVSPVRHIWAQTLSLCAAAVTLHCGPPKTENRSTRFRSDSLKKSQKKNKQEGDESNAWNCVGAKSKREVLQLGRRGCLGLCLIRNPQQLLHIDLEKVEEHLQSASPCQQAMLVKKYTTTALASSLKEMHVANCVCQRKIGDDKYDTA